MRNSSGQANAESGQFAEYKDLIFNQFDPKSFLIGTFSATAGRLAFYPIEATSFSLQIGTAKTEYKNARLAWHF